jgi:hypothetical protein
MQYLSRRPYVVPIGLRQHQVNSVLGVPQNYRNQKTDRMDPDTELTQCHVNSSTGS